MPEFEGTSETLSFQGALEEAVRKAYTAYQRRTHTEPLFTYVVKRISGHLRTLTVVIETVLDEDKPQPSAAAPEESLVAAPAEAPRPSSSTTEPTEAASSTADPVKALLEKERRNEPLTPNERALIELLRQDPKR
jgi:hypothetical protein